MNKLALIRTMFFEIIMKKNLVLYSSVFHSDFKIYLFDETAMDYSEYRSFYEKVFAEPLEIIVEFNEDTFVESKRRFSGEIVFILDHQISGRIKFPISINAQFKGGKIFEIRVASEFEWSLIDYLMEAVADVLNNLIVPPCFRPALK